MIAKGTPHDNGVRLARYLITGKQGEIASLCELSGFASADIVEAFRSVHVMAAGTQCEHPFFHIQVRNPEGESLTREQWLIVADRIERMLGLSGQPRAIAFHTDRRSGGEHMHLGFSRIDSDTLTARKLPFFKRRLNKVSRDLEIELGLTRVRADRNSAIRYAPLRPQEEQARRLGVDIHDVLETVRECFDSSDCGRSFTAALAHHQLILAQGERRDFVVVDHAGGIHALGKRILGLSAAQIRTRLADLARESLPTVEQARQQMGAKQGSRKKQTAAPRHGANRKRDQLQAPASQIAAASSKALEADDENPDWKVLPALPSPTGSEDERISPDNMPPHGYEIDPEVLTCEVDNAEPAPSGDLAGNRIATKVLPEQSPTPKRAGLADALRKQFRAAVKAVFKREPSPGLQARRRRRGEVVGSFRSAARCLLRPIIHLPGVSRAIASLHDMMPWFQLWDWNETGDHDVTREPGASDDNHFSPHP